MNANIEKLKTNIHRLREITHSQIRDLKESTNNLMDNLKMTTQNQLHELKETTEKKIDKLTEKIHKENEIKNERKFSQSSESGDIDSRNGAKLPELEYSVLREHRVEMVNKLDAKDLKDFLFQYGLIDMNQKDYFEKELRKEGVETILKYVYYSGKDGFSNFCRALDDAGYTELHTTLTQHLQENTRLKRKLEEEKSEEKGHIARKFSQSTEPKDTKAQAHTMQQQLTKLGITESMSESESTKLKNQLEETKSEQNENIKQLKETIDQLKEKIEQQQQQQQQERERIVKEISECPDYISVVDTREFEGLDSDGVIKRVKEWDEKRDEWFENKYIPWCVRMSDWFKDNKYYNKQSLSIAITHWFDVVKRSVGKYSDWREDRILIYKYLLNKNNQLINDVTTSFRWLKKCKNREDLEQDIKKWREFIDREQAEDKQSLDRLNDYINKIINKQTVDDCVIIGPVYFIYCDKVLSDLILQWNKL